jgi:LacI family transcriptional regulator
VSGGGRAKQRAAGVVRLSDVAEAAGVGTSIASRVINDDPTVSIRPETRARILEAARRLDYRPNAFARGLKVRRTTTLGMVIPNLTYPINSEIILGAERAASAAGYVILLADADEFEQSGEAYRRLLLEQRTDGLLIASASASEPVLKEIAQRGLPFVLVNRRGPRIAPSICVDDERGMAMAVERLVALGHERIAMITGPRDADTAARRLAGVRSGLRAAGLKLPARYVVEATYEEEQGFQAMEGLLSLDRRPTAVLVWSLAAAIGALAAAKRRQLRVPADVSIVGFHDAPIASYFDPPLTTVRMPLAEMAERSVEMVLALIEGRAVESGIIRTPPELIERGSIGPAPR